MENQVSKLAANAHGGSQSLAVAGRTIWLWWSSGEATLSPFLKTCLESWRVQHPSWQVVLLDMDNLWGYLSPEDLPSSFTAITRPSLQSDLVRLAVLAKHGGCYADLSCLALADCAEAAWQVLQQGRHTFVGYRAPHFISDFVSAWFLVVKAGDPLVGEWSRCLNMLMDGRIDDKGVHRHPFFGALDLHEYLNHGVLEVGFNSVLWADYLVVNVTLKAVLERDPVARARFWNSAVLMAEADLSLSPTTWSHATPAPNGMVFPASENWKMQRLLHEDAVMHARLKALPMLKFFNSGSVFAGLSREELLSSCFVIGRMVQQALSGVCSAAVHFERALAAVPCAAVPALRLEACSTGLVTGGAQQRTTQSVPPRHVVVATLVTSNFFAAGAACLGRSLRLHGNVLNGTRMVCLVPEGLCREAKERHWLSMLRDAGWELLPVEDFSAEDFPGLFEELENPCYQVGFMKLHLWDLPRRLGRPVHRVLYIDSDAVVVGDLKKALYSRVCEPPAAGLSMCPDYDWRAGKTSCSNQDPIAAAAAFKLGSYCNAGVLLLRPSAALHDELLQRLHGYKTRGLAEQDFLHDVFTSAGRTKVLEQGYNAQKWIRICAPDLWQTYELKIIRYNDTKPWALCGSASDSVEASFEAENAECADLVRLWFKLFAFGGPPPLAAANCNRKVSRAYRLNGQRSKACQTVHVYTPSPDKKT